MGARQDKWLVHAIAWCEDCEWSSGAQNTSTAAAQRHATKTGHRVSGEQGYTYRYNQDRNP